MTHLLILYLSLFLPFKTLRVARKAIPTVTAMLVLWDLQTLDYIVSHRSNTERFWDSWMAMDLMIGIH